MFFLGGQRVVWEGSLAPKAPPLVAPMVVG